MHSNGECSSALVTCFDTSGVEDYQRVISDFDMHEIVVASTMADRRMMESDKGNASGSYQYRKQRGAREYNSTGAATKDNTMIPENRIAIPQKYEIGSKRLHFNYSPGQFDAICGRGAEVFNHPGNKIVRELAAKKSYEYGQARSRTERSSIVSSILDEVCRRGNGFVKLIDEGSIDRDCSQRTAYWIAVGDNLAREKIGQMLRNSLSHRYRSSTAVKTSRRQKRSSKLQKTLEIILSSDEEVLEILVYTRSDSFRQMLSATGSDQDATTMLFQQANMSLLSAFKNNRNLVKRFQDATTSSLSCSMPLETCDDSSSSCCDGMEIEGRGGTSHARMLWE